MAINEHQAMTLYCRKNDLQAQQIIFTLVEKNFVFKIEWVESEILPDFILTQSLSPQLPTLVDRDLVLFDLDIILTYLDERLPSPPLMPIMPIDRAKRKMAIYQIRHEWMRDFMFLQDQKFNPTADELTIAQCAQNFLDQLTANSVIFTEYAYFLDDKLNLCDCYFAPLLLRLSELGLELPKSAKRNYAIYINKMQNHPAWLESLVIFE